MRKQFLLTGIIVLGFILRLFILSQRGSFWFDEAFSAHFASMDLGQMWSYLKFENNPPLYFVLLHFWMKLFGTSELVVRSLSMAFGVASIPMVYLVGKRLHSSTAGNFAAFLLAISTFQVFYSTETRMYSMYLFLALCTVWMFWKNHEARNKRYDFMLHTSLFIILVLLVWTHITAWLIVAALLTFLWWQRLHHKRSDRTFCGGRWVLAGVALAAVSLLPWFVDFVRLKIASPLSQGWFFYIPPPRNFFLDILEGFLVFGENNAFIVTLLSVVIVVLIWQAMRGTNIFSPCPRGRLRGGGSGPPLNPLLEKEGKALRFLLCWLFVPLVIGFAFQNAVPRYFIAVAPALYILLGIGFGNAMTHIRLPAGKAGVRSFTESTPHRTCSGAGFRMTKWLAPLFLFVLILPDYSSLAKIGNHQWDKLVHWVKQSEGVRCQVSGVRCLVLVNPHSEVLAFERYYRGKLPVVGFYPREDNWDRDMRIVRTNWVGLVDEKNIRALTDITKGYDRVFLITGETDPDAPRNLIPAWFWEQGWRKVEGQEFGRVGVLLLEH